MSTTGSMVTLSSLATMDEDVDTLQVRGGFCVGVLGAGVWAVVWGQDSSSQQQHGAV